MLFDEEDASTSQAQTTSRDASSSLLAVESKFLLDDPSRRCSAASRARPNKAEEDLYTRVNLARRRTTRRTSPGKIYVSMAREERQNSSKTINQEAKAQITDEVSPHTPNTNSAARMPSMSFATDNSGPRSSLQLRMPLNSPRLNYGV